LFIIYFLLLQRYYLFRLDKTLFLFLVFGMEILVLFLQFGELDLESFVLLFQLFHFLFVLPNVLLECGYLGDICRFKLAIFSQSLIFLFDLIFQTFHTTWKSSILVFEYVILFIKFDLLIFQFLVMPLITLTLLF
jgi:hypothetical protein